MLIAAILEIHTLKWPRRQLLHLLTAAAAAAAAWWWGHHPAATLGCSSSMDTLTCYKDADSKQSNAHMHPTLQSHLWPQQLAMLIAAILELHTLKRQRRQLLHLLATTTAAAAAAARWRGHQACCYVWLLQQHWGSAVEADCFHASVNNSAGPGFGYAHHLAAATAALYNKLCYEQVHVRHVGCISDSASPSSWLAHHLAATAAGAAALCTKQISVRHATRMSNSGSPGCGYAHHLVAAAAAAAAAAALATSTSVSGVWCASQRKPQQLACS
jgi:hypothetical protein